MYKPSLQFSNRWDKLHFAHFIKCTVIHMMSTKAGKPVQLAARAVEASLFLSATKNIVKSHLTK